MVFNDTSSVRIAAARRRAGFTLVEFLVSLALAGILGAVVMSAVIYSARSYASMVNYIDLDRTSRHALDSMILDVREGLRVVSCNATNLGIRTMAGDVVDFRYDPAGRTLTRYQAGVPAKVLLTECDSLEYRMYLRAPKEGEFAQYDAATTAYCKVVQVNWVCSRKILGRTWNTESVQTAKIVMRNQRNPSTL